jgi:hypothetical protein
MRTPNLGKRRFIQSALSLAFAALTWLGIGTTSRAQEGTDEVATLEERLTFGLKARRESERAYCKLIATKVAEGEIPKDLVDGSFFWVRKNKANHNFPFFYFQQILRMRGKALGIEIP